MRNSNWFDRVIQAELDKHDAKVIAQAIAASSQLLNAIKKALNNKPDPNTIGLSHAQMIADAIKDVLVLQE